jgi:uncharacterized protein YjbI with pentapeptide repeats
MKKIINAIEIIEQINSGKNICIEDTEIEGDLDLTKVDDTIKETSENYISYISSHLSFINCRFKGSVIANHHSFENIRHNLMFQRNVSFEGSVFEGEANFERARFSGKTTFRKVSFNDEAIFGKAQFIGKSTFREAFFNDYADFVYANFLSVGDFRKVTFNDEIDFGFTRFGTYVDFGDAKFNGNVIYRTQFIGEVNFHKAVFKLSTLISSQFNHGVHLKGVVFSGGIDFEDSEFYGYVNFEDVVFEKRVNFQDVRFFTPHIIFNKARFLGDKSFTGSTLYGKSFNPTL